MKDRPQWCVAGASKAPMSMVNGKLIHVSVTDPGSWMTFEAATTLAWSMRDVVTEHTNAKGITVTQKGYTVGYVINQADPFTCIDLDVKDMENAPDQPDKWTTPEQFIRYQNITQTLDSYSEMSQSGKGWHIWVKGAIGRGYRRDGIEVYSQERFIICTGDAFFNKPVADRQYLLNNMIAQMRPMAKTVELEEIPEEADDWYILSVAANAANADKFLDLWDGKWRDYGWESQSEADLALMSMFTFYSASNAQCRRLFRESKLGKREKAVKDDRYLNFTLKTIRERQAREDSVDFSGLIQQEQDKRLLTAQAVAQIQGGVGPVQGEAGVFGAVAPRTTAPLQVPGGADPVVPQAPADAQLAQLAPVTPLAHEAGQKGLAWPPGFVGALAQYFHNSAFLPIKEVSIISALALMAGVAGKAWHIPKSGLNLYLVMVARSAIGKEALHTNLSNMVSHAIRKNPSVGKFVDFTEYASGPALIKACAMSTSFVNVSGEWGRRMKRIAMEDEREGPMTTLRTQMTHLYQKSAPNSIVGGMGYSSQENNVEAMQAVAYSMVGESTPRTFFDSLTESMMEDGFLSRFIIIQYEGDRPEENPKMLDYPDESLLNYFTAMSLQADTNIGQGVSQFVDRTNEAADILAEFSSMAAKRIRGTDDEGRRQMWNRATLKALRVAGILAVGDNYMHPIINADHARWAIDLIMSDIGVMTKRIDGGDVGVGDATRERSMVKVMKDYLSKEPAPSYKVNKEMWSAQVCPKNYLQTKLSQKSAFYKHKLGPAAGIDMTLQMLISNGYIMEIKNAKLVENFGFHGRAFRILNLPDYAAMDAEKDDPN